MKKTVNFSQMTSFCVGFYGTLTNNPQFRVRLKGNKYYILMARRILSVEIRFHYFDQAGLFIDFSFFTVTHDFIHPNKGKNFLRFDMESITCEL